MTTGAQRCISCDGFLVAAVSGQLAVGTPHHGMVWSMESLSMCGRKLPWASFRSLVQVIRVAMLRCAHEDAGTQAQQGGQMQE
jgi:hypothetical protein